MDVTIGIPTFKNDGRTILYTLQSLTKQTYADFKVLIAYKPSENDRTLDVIEKFTKSLDLKIMFQREGYFDEALNMIYSTSKSDILISTDDDAVPSTNWVESHIRAHENFYDAGVIGPFLGISHRSSLIARLYSNIFEDPLEEDMRLSNNYFAKTGILVRNNLFRNAGSKVRTFNPIGVNMSIKKEVYSDFKLPNMTLRGINNELYLCLHAYEKGYPCTLVNEKIEVEHFDRDSMSRPKNLSGIIERFAEFSLSVYYLSKLGYDLDFKKLKLDIFLKSIPWKFKKDEKLKAQLVGIKKGIDISLEALKLKKDEKWIRQKLMEIRGEQQNSSNVLRDYQNV
ncbi:glycosyltransferase family A protein [Sulfuracidifex tepidarius]|uniref:Glycosyltransferase 2-like domain-containing protein n=1 Tax=Sulfuracidifex tepidarius TaxID=1294262 RepID=A0A510E584_9CREN|nr:glycosyltransferase family 2 protein [Sulfuracidifex tepidarius]BBG24896.1 hypothetical protein IC006_2230 [Sulfuracidifex tepidarius]BBG27681.1 hypothetical protein IC007_2235 [Sulfuracidifex tepidarius]